MERVALTALPGHTAPPIPLLRPTYSLFGPPIRPEARHPPDPGPAPLAGRRAPRPEGAPPPTPGASRRTGSGRRPRPRAPHPGGPAPPFRRAGRRRSPGPVGPPPGPSPLTGDGPAGGGPRTSRGRSRPRPPVARAPRASGAPTAPPQTLGRPGARGRALNLQSGLPRCRRRGWAGPGAASGWGTTRRWDHSARRI